MILIAESSSLQEVAKKSFVAGADIKEFFLISVKTKQKN